MHFVRWFWPARVALLLAFGIVAWPASPLHAMAPAAATATEVSGNINTDTTWTLANSPYVLTGNIFIGNGATLTIQPGVKVSATAGHPPTSQPFRINVDDGALVANGTAAQPITFTASEAFKGAWYGIAAGNTADDPSILTLRHVTVEYGGGPIFPGEDFGLFDGGNVEVDGPAQVTIEDSILRNSSSNGLNGDLRATIALANIAFNNNILTAVRFESNVLFDPQLSGLSGGGNGLNAVQYNNTHITPETGDFELEVSGLATRLEGGFFVDEGGHATIAPGVEAQVQNGFYVDGQLTAAGTAGQPVTITGIDKTPGGWQGISVSGNTGVPAQALFDHVIIEYGGGAGNDSSANLVVGSSLVTVTNSIIRNGGSSGIYNSGGAPGEPLSLLVQNTQITGNGGRAFFCDDESCNQKLSALTISGNGVNAIVQRGSMIGDRVWNNLGIPYLVEQASGIGIDSKLVVEPGVTVLFDQDARFSVDGVLLAVGTPTQPITFTGSKQQTGWWQGIYVSSPSEDPQHPESGIAELSYCDIGYGGTTSFGMVQLASNTAFISNCRIHHSAGSGIETLTNVAPIITHNRFEENPTYGLENSNGTRFPLTVDARDNWWGDPSGPQHATNANGKGDAVSDRVLFDPWLTTADGAGVGGLEVRLAGVGRYSPGETIQYGIFYSNMSNETVTGAVLRVALPANSQFEDSTAGGIYWPDRRQVFWKLGSLAPGKSGSLALRVTYDWGLPDGIRTTIAAQLSGSNVPDSPFTVADYLNYTERKVTGETELSEADLTAARGRMEDLQILYDQAIADGFVFGSARRQNFNTGDVLNEAIMIKFEPQLSVFYLWWQGGETTATGARVDGSSFTVYKPGRGLRYELQTNQWADVASTALVAAGDYTWSDCMKNCIEEKLPGYIVKKHIKVLSNASKAISCVSASSGEAADILKCSKIIGKSIPGYGEAVDLGLCNSDCQNCEASGGSSDNEKCHYCTEDKYRCSDDDWLYGTFDIDVVKVRRCSEGKYLAEEVVRICATCEKCIDNGGSPVCTAKNVFANFVTLAVPPGLQATTANMALLSAPIVNECETCLRAKDPNEMHGPAGDLLPGQVVSYTIDFENVGEGDAFGVYISNHLGDEFDISTLQLSGDAYFSAGARTIYFQIGDLAPKGQPGSKGQVSYSVKLRSDLPSGTVVSNQATVFFASVPEETPTNSVVNVIQPIVVQPQALQTPFQQAKAITLQGKDAINKALTFKVVDGPLYGELTGTPPNLTYKPAPGFVGLDRFTFVANNGTSTSREAEVQIEVLPNPNDHSAPTLLWTAPENGSRVDAAMTLATGGVPLYTPRIQLQFSEAMNASTVTTATIQLKIDGQPTPIDVQYDRTTDQAVLLLQTAPKPNAPYVVTVGTGVKDLAGNALATPFVLTFTTGNFAQPAGGVLFLPNVQAKQQ
jgi:uncharacterized repeat protein (TIGR01451 family)